MHFNVYLINHRIYAHKKILLLYNIFQDKINNFILSLYKYLIKEKITKTVGIINT